ncbi:hypothetical protein ACA910_012268 [Epithemia clementina (nom. ined.)]
MFSSSKNEKRVSLSILNSRNRTSTTTDGSESHGRTYWKEAFIVLLVIMVVNVLQLFNGVYDPSTMLIQLAAMNINESPTRATKDHQPKKNPRKVFVDLGANCGNSFLKLLNSERGGLSSDWEAYLWEPNPQLLRFFLNGNFVKTYPQVTIIPRAAGARDETLQLYYTKGQELVSDKSQFADKGVCDPKSFRNPSGGTSLLKESNAVGTASVKVPVVDFAKWLKNLGLQKENGDRLLLKIDVEGAELELLDRLLLDEFDDICLAEKISIEWHAALFPQGSPLFSKHENYKKSFKARLDKKCQRDISVGGWH